MTYQPRPPNTAHRPAPPPRASPACRARRPGAGGAGSSSSSASPARLQEPHQWLARRMEASHPGLKIRLVPSESQDIVAQIKAAQGYSPYDAMPNGEPPHLIAHARGLHPEGQAGQDPELRQRVPGVHREEPGLRRAGELFADRASPITTSWSRPPPKAWTDLWNAEYRGKVGIPRASSNLGLGVLVIAAKVFGGSEDNLEPGWSKLQELKPSVGRSPTQLLQMLEREEIALAPIWNNDAAGAAEKGLPIKFVQPDPGPSPSSRSCRRSRARAIPISSING